MSEIPEIDIVIPVKNEEHDLAPSVTRLVAYLRDAFPFTARVTITVPQLALRESVYRKSAALPAPAGAVSHSGGRR